MSVSNEDMNRVEELLRKSLRRDEVPPGFADRVMARVSQQSSMPEKARRVFSQEFFSRPLVRWAAFAAVSASLIVGGIHYRDVQRERAQGEAAKQQLMLALHIAGSKLQLARAKVNEINSNRPEGKPAKDRSRSKS